MLPHSSPQALDISKVIYLPSWASLVPGASVEVRNRWPYTHLQLPLQLHEVKGRENRPESILGGGEEEKEE